MSVSAMSPFGSSPLCGGKGCSRDGRDMCLIRLVSHHFPLNFSLCKIHLTQKSLSSVALVHPHCCGSVALVHPHCCAAITAIRLQNASQLVKHGLPISPGPAASLLLPVCDLTPLRASRKGNRSVCVFVIGVFHLACVLELHSCGTTSQSFLLFKAE